MSTKAPEPPIRMLLVDDSPWQREGWAVLFGSQPDLEVVGQAGDGAQALGLLRRELVDVVLMDIHMPRVNGLVATERILGDEQVRANGPAPRIILVANVDLDDHVPAAAVAGAYAVLYKDAEPEALFEVIREAAFARHEI
ncbi:MAG TPA: response regulator transcription factor [Pseudolysinimonas sp.]|nr:response regulator transcription factor [Pseudolysinimonas sp.]